MASVYDEREDSVLDSRKPTLLDAVEETNRALGQKSLVHRVVCISQVSEDERDSTQIGNHYEKLFKHLQTVFQSEPISGLLLIYKKHLIHVIETSTDMLLKYVEDLVSIENDDRGFATQSKILVISHDIAHRLYGQWSFRVMDIEMHNMDQYDSTEDTIIVVGDVLSQLLKLGVFLSKQAKLNLKNVMDSLHEKVPELLPQQGVIHYLLAQDDDCMMLPQEYMDIYQMPFDITLDSDLAWPIAVKLFPY